MSVHTPIPECVRELVHDTVHSLEQLEILLRLHAEPTLALSLETLVAELGFVPELCQTALQQLVDGGLVRRENKGPWLYAPRTASLDQAVRALAQCYLNQRVELMMMISDDAVGRVRRGAREMFNESLRWRRKPAQ